MEQKANKIKVRPEVNYNLYDTDGIEATCNAGDLGWIPASGRSPGGGHGSPLQPSRLENFHGRRNLRRLLFHGVPKSQTQLSNEEQHPEALAI